ncbi:MAG: 4Fe-4S binding protein [Rikenellaceae bacterium]|jgi:NADH-quinone oxidoreductase subunit I|nr:4Fe-4S binding protein [Rikenellaceae bacterium]
MKKYITDIALGLWRLFQGMYITMLNFVRPKFTEQYPENRGEKEYFDRFRALLVMPHDERNHHKCTACGICQTNCPNGTIEVVSRMEADEATGRDKKTLDRYMYDLGSCTFCGLCTHSCPFGAIRWSNEFEHSLFTRSKLHMQLNRPGSSLAPKPAPAPVPAAPAAEPAKKE